MDKGTEIERLLTEYLMAAEAGAAPPLTEWIDRHPNHRAELIEFFALRRDIELLASPVRDHAPLPAPPAPSAFPLPFGEYTLLGELGRGGMGIVYRAALRHPARTVALKVIRAGRFATADDRLRFRIEIEAAARLSHPAIVPVHDVGEVDGHPYYTTPVFTGGDLTMRRAQLGADPEKSARVVRDIAAAIHHAHQHGVLHRDLKPSNILFDEAGRPHVSDFGLAKVATESTEPTQTGQFLGTPAYMSPEQALGLSTTAMTDVYGLGCLLYFALTGRAPFEGSGVAVVLDRVRTTEPAPLRRTDPVVSRDLEAVCLKCLAKSPARRYPSAATVVEDLDRFLTGRPTVARPIGLFERLTRWVWRKPSQAAAYGFAMGVIVLSGLAGFLGHLLQRAEESRVEAVVATERAENSHRQTCEALERERHSKEREANLRAALVGVSSIRAVVLAHQHYRANNVHKANELLSACPLEFRNWEWWYVYRLCHRARIVLSAGGRGLASVAVAPDGSSLFTAGTHGIKRWDTTTWEPFRLTHEPARGLAIRRDGALLTTFVPSGEASLTACETKLSSFTLDGQLAAQWEPIRLANQSDGGEANYVPHPEGATGSDMPGKRIWYGLLMLSDRFDPAAGAPRAQAFDADGRRIAFGGKYKEKMINISTPTPYEGRLFVVDSTSQRHLASISIPESSVTAIGFGPDERGVISGLENGRVILWDWQNQQELINFVGHRSPVTAVMCSPDGRFVAAAAKDRTIRVWRINPLPKPSSRTDCITRTELEVLSGPALPTRRLVFAPSGDRLYSGSDDGTVSVWDLDTNPASVRLSNCTQLVTSAFLTPDGSRIVTSGDTTALQVFDARTGDLVWEEKALAGLTVRALQIVRGGRLEGVLQSGLLRQWGLKSGSPDTATTPERLPLRGAVVDTTADRTRVLTRTWDERLVVFDARTREPVCVIPAHPGREFGASLSADGKRIVTGGTDRLGRVWDADTGTELVSLHGHVEPVTATAISPDGTRFVTGAQDGQVKLWDARTGNEVLSINGRTHPVTALGFTENGTVLFVVYDDGVVAFYRGGSAKG